MDNIVHIQAVYDAGVQFWVEGPNGYERLHWLEVVPYSEGAVEFWMRRYKCTKEEIDLHKNNVLLNEKKNLHQIICCGINKDGWPCTRVIASYLSFGSWLVAHRNGGSTRIRCHLHKRQRNKYQ